MNQRRSAPRPARILLILAVLGLAACGNGKLAKLSDAELQDRIYDCNTTHSQSPGFAISCDNYQRECKRRREEGRFVC